MSEGLTVPEGSEAAIPSRLRLAVVVLCLCAPLYVACAAVTQGLLNLAFGLWFTEIFVFFGLAWTLTRFTGRSPAAYARLAFPGARAALMGLALGITNYFALVIPLQGLALRFAPRWLQDWAPDSGQIFEGQRPWELALVLGAVSLAAPVCEEFTFRGVLQQGFFPRAATRWPAIFLTAALFSAFHLDPIGFWARFEMGILFGWLFQRAGSLWPNALAHSGNNVTTTALYLLFRDSKGDTTDLPLPQLFGVGAVGLALMLALLSLTRKYPALIQGRAPPQEVVLPRLSSLWRAAAPWLIGALASLLLLFALDHRGVEVNVVDNLYPLPSAESPHARRQETHRLEELRRKVLSGKASVAEYAQRRRALSQSSKP